MPNTKEYMKKYNKQYYQKNKKKIDKRSRQWRKDNPVKNKEYIKEYTKEYNCKNKEKISERVKQYCIKNKDKIRKQRKQYYIKNRERLNKYSKQYQIDNKDEIDKQRKIPHNEWLKKHRKNKYKTSIKFNLNCKMSTAIGLSIKGNKNGRHWETLVGYTLDDLVKRLKKTMPEGYCWEDYINGRLHLDHKIPISVFNFEKPEHINFKRCWALKNLQLLPARENLIKSNKIKKPFQLSLQV